MKKKIFTMLLLVLAAITMTSCNDDEPTPQYTFFKPCTHWMASPDEVRSYMAACNGWSETMSEGDLVLFKNENTKTAIIYAFRENALVASIVTVSGFNSMFPDFEKQIAAEYDLKFTSATLCDYGINPSLHMCVATHKFSTYMTAAYFNLGFLQVLGIDPSDFNSLLALIDKIKAGLLPQA